MFYGIKSLAFLLHETKIGKGGGADGRDGGEQETALPQLLVVTPHFFLHNFWHLLPAMPALSVSEGGVTHSLSCWGSNCHSGRSGGSSLLTRRHREGCPEDC